MAEGQHLLRAADDRSLPRLLRALVFVINVEWVLSQVVGCMFVATTGEAVVSGTVHMDGRDTLVGRSELSAKTFAVEAIEFRDIEDSIIAILPANELQWDTGPRILAGSGVSFRLHLHNTNTQNTLPNANRPGLLEAARLAERYAARFDKSQQGIVLTPTVLLTLARDLRQRAD